MNTTVYKYFNSQTEMDCAAQCFREFCCRSANFRKITLNYGRENCELLHDLASEEPRNFKRQRTYDYLLVGQEKVRILSCFFRNNDQIKVRLQKKVISITLTVIDANYT